MPWNFDFVVAKSNRSMVKCIKANKFIIYRRNEVVFPVPFNIFVVVKVSFTCWIQLSVLAWRYNQKIIYGTFLQQHFGTHPHPHTPHTHTLRRRNTLLTSLDMFSCNIKNVHFHNISTIPASKFCNAGKEGWTQKTPNMLKITHYIFLLLQCSLNETVIVFALLVLH